MMRFHPIRMCHLLNQNPSEAILYYWSEGRVVPDETVPFREIDWATRPFVSSPNRGWHRRGRSWHCTVCDFPRSEPQVRVSCSNKKVVSLAVAFDDTKADGPRGSIWQIPPRFSEALSLPFGQIQGAQCRDASLFLSICEATAAQTICCGSIGANCSPRSDRLSGNANKNVSARGQIVVFVSSRFARA